MAANPAALRRFVVAAGFEVVEMGRPYMLGYGPSAPPLRRRHVGGLLRKGLLRRGVPHVWLRARPLSV